MAPPQARDWARLQRHTSETVLRPDPATAAEDGAARRTPYMVAVAWGLLWRYAVVGTITLAMFGGIRPPIAGGAVVAGAGVLLGLWFRRGWVACVWRAAVLGWVAGLASSTFLLPFVVVGALAVITIEPWVVARGRPAPAPGRATGGRADGRRQPPLPGSVWPRAGRRT